MPCKGELEEGREGGGGGEGRRRRRGGKKETEEEEKQGRVLSRSSHLTPLLASVMKRVRVGSCMHMHESRGSR